MVEMFDWIQSNTSEILIGTLVIQGILLILAILSLIKIRGIKKRYKQLLEGTKAMDLEGVLFRQIEKMEKAEKEINTLYDELLRLEKGAGFCIQKVKSLRYNTFDNTGSDLSYSTALLDIHNSGVILTGIYGRNYGVSYCKPIVKGTSKHVLSEEEKKVLNEAMAEKVLIRNV